MAAYRIDANTGLSFVSPPITTQDAYAAETDTILDIRTMREKALLVKNNNGTNGLTYQVLGSLDNGASYDLTVKGDTAVAANSQDLFRNSEYCTHWKVRVRSSVASSAAAAIVKLAAVQ